MVAVIPSRWATAISFFMASVMVWPQTTSTWERRSRSRPISMPLLCSSGTASYCHIDYDDDIEILELMLDTTLDEMTELIPNFDRNNLTSRQKLLAFMSVKELYDNRDKYRSDTKTLSAAVSSMLLKEIYGGAAE